MGREISKRDFQLFMRDGGVINVHHVVFIYWEFEKRKGLQKPQMAVIITSQRRK